ncbi:MAG: hypothetical protein KDJ52_00350 [Anaerolineae bacterium]|nr:hypothetical protein [Anaerolineae bacterium]
MEKVIMSVVLEPSQKAILVRLAEQDDRTQSAVIRRLLEQEAQRREVEKPKVRQAN